MKWPRLNVIFPCIAAALLAFGIGIPREGSASAATDARRVVFIPGIVPNCEAIAYRWSALVQDVVGAPCDAGNPFGAVERGQSTFGQIRMYLKSTLGYRDADFYYFNYAPEWLTEDAYSGEHTRQSLTISAASLGQQLRHWGLADARYDIIAHSLGGAVATYLLANDPDAAFAVHSLTTLDSPVRGLKELTLTGMASYLVEAGGTVGDDLQTDAVIAAMAAGARTVDVVTLSNALDEVVPGLESYLDGACPPPHVVGTCQFALDDGTYDRHGAVLTDPSTLEIIGKVIMWDGPLWLANRGVWPGDPVGQPAPAELAAPSNATAATVACVAAESSTQPALNSTLEDQAKEHALLRVLRNVNTAQGQWQNRANSVRYGQLEYLNAKISARGSNGEYPLCAADIVRGIVPASENWVDVSWEGQDYEVFTGTGGVTRVGIGELHIRSLQARISNRASLSPANLANGIEWSGEVRIDFIAQHRGMTRDSRSFDRPQAPSHAFSQWYDGYIIATAEKRNGQWTRPGQPLPLYVPFKAFELSVLRGTYRPPCGTPDCPMAAVVR
jgi:pimeloyl-ACP methyl ester carboxylesterase